MKYDLSKSPTRGARRTLDALRSTMFALLSEKAFEEITVGELCERAQYPRATFYNYFDDKYDLLNYCWQTLAERVGLREQHRVDESETLYAYFDRIYDFTKQSMETIRKVLSHNGEAGYMLLSFKTFLNVKMRMIFKDCPDAAQIDIPNELLADHYSNTLFLVWQWAAIKDSACSKERAHGYLKLLIGAEERED